jgi:hypothetical protein
LRNLETGAVVGEHRPFKFYETRKSFDIALD